MGVINQQVSLSPVFSIKLFIFRKSVKKKSYMSVYPVFLFLVVSRFKRREKSWQKKRQSDTRRRRGRRGRRRREG